MKDLAQAASDLIDRFHVSSVKTQHERRTWGSEALATATSKTAYD